MTQRMSNSQLLHARMQVTCGQLSASLRHYWSQSDLRARVPAFFVLMHQIVRASVPLMEAARSVALQRTDHDPVCRLLAPYLAHHSLEECDHDVWLLEDLAAAGILQDEVTSAIPSPNVAALVGAQYYWAVHHHPVALMGYMRLLEGNAPSQAHIDRLERLSGLPAASFRTYRLHGDLDAGHLRQMDAFLDSLPLSDAQANVIWISASHTARMLARCLEDIEQEDTNSAIRRACYERQ